MALVTNGTYRPVGDWPNKLAWIRVSLDAATPATYAKFRGRPLFPKVINNFLSYLDYEVPHVGISFLFSMHNIAEYTKVAAFIYQLVQTERPSQLHKVNIQYRPLRRDPYHSREPFLEAITKEDIQSTMRDILDLADSSPDIAAFLRDQTNIIAILGGNTHPPYPFPRCYYSQTFKIIRANGDIRPCFVRVFEDDFCLGNLLTDPLETIALNTLYVGARRKEHCDSHGCRQCHVNFTFDQGLAGVLARSESPGVRDDPMY